MEHVQVLIVGAGIAGISAAIWCKRLGLHPVVIESNEQIGGQLMQIKNEIWDFPPNIYNNGQELFLDLCNHTIVQQLDLRLHESLTFIHPTDHLIQTNKTTYHADFVIMATGVRQNSLPALQHSKIVLTPWFSTTSKAEFLRDKQVLVIGGGDRALESVFNLSSYAKHIWLVARGASLRARAEWVERTKQCNNVTILMETQVIATVESSKQTGAYVQKSTEEHPVFLPVEWILPRIGVRGNSDTVDFLTSFDGGFLSVDEYQMTSIDWIYAIGDITNGSVYASLALAVGQSMKAAKHISLCTKERNTLV